MSEDISLQSFSESGNFPHDSTLDQAHSQPSPLSSASGLESSGQQSISNPDSFSQADQKFGESQADSSDFPQNAQSHELPSLQEMEQEAARLRELNAQLDDISGAPSTEIDPQKFDADAKSVYVGNVDYGATPIELQQHFSSCGAAERVTIMTNKHTGQPKGFAYLEFASADDANEAVATLDGSTFRDRELKVSLKRTNIPGLSATGRGGFMGRGRGRGMFRGRGRGGFRGRGMARGGPRFSPY